MTEDPIDVVDDTAKSLFHLASTLQYRSEHGEEFSPGEIVSVAKRLQDHAADLQVAASRLR